MLFTHMDFTFRSIVKYYTILLMANKDEPKEYLRIAEASKLLGVHPNTLRNWDRSGVLKPIRVGVRRGQERRYKRTDLIKFIEQQNK